MSGSNTVSPSGGHVPSLVGLDEVGLHQGVAEGFNPSLRPAEPAGHALDFVKRLHSALPRRVLPTDPVCLNSWGGAKEKTSSRPFILSLKGEGNETSGREEEGRARGRERGRREGKRGGGRVGGGEGEGGEGGREGWRERETERVREREGKMGEKEGLTKDIVGLALLISRGILTVVAAEPGSSGVERRGHGPATVAAGMVRRDDGAHMVLEGPVAGLDGGQAAQEVVVVVHAVSGHGGHSPRDPIVCSAARGHRIARQGRRLRRRRRR